MIRYIWRYIYLRQIAWNLLDIDSPQHNSIYTAGCRNFHYLTIFFHQLQRKQKTKNLLIKEKLHTYTSLLNLIITTFYQIKKTSLSASQRRGWQHSCCFLSQDFSHGNITGYKHTSFDTKTLIRSISTKYMHKHLKDNILFKFLV